MSDAYTFSANLDNFTADRAIFEEQDMATEHRRVLIGWNDDRTPIYKHISGQSQDEVNDKIVREYIANGRIFEFMDRPKTKEPDKIIFRDYAEKWLKRKRKLKPTTKVNYKKYIDQIVSRIGDKELSDISVEDVQDILDSYSELSHKTLKDMKGVMHQILKYAKSDGYISTNPCESVDIEIPSDKVKIRKALPISQFKDILAHMNQLQPRDRIYLSLIMYTAMRRGEALGLKWEDVDFTNEVLHICRNVTHPQQNTPVVTTPKTEAGIRDIPIDETLISILKPWKSEGYILGGDKPLTLSAFRAMMKRINSAIDLHGATAHILRHSYLTYAVGETTDFKTIQGISGHADFSTLVNKYAHPQEDKMKDLAKRMHQRLNG